MPGPLDFLNPVKGLAEAASGIIDQFVDSPEEAAKAKQMLMEEERKTLTALYEARSSIVESQAGIIESEAESSHWLAANIRPLTLLSFLLIALYAGIFAPIFGAPAPMLGEIPPKAWTVIMIGLGGYIGGRTAEKLIPRSKWAKPDSSGSTEKIAEEVLDHISDAGSG